MHFDLTQIGTIYSEFDEPVDPHEMRTRESTIVVEEAFEDGLYRIEDNEYVVILAYMHESGDFELRGPRLYGVERGTFACRSPNRPSPIGLTTVELLDRDGRTLRVSGLDAIDGTPVLDIKPYAPEVDRPPLEDDDRRERPRAHLAQSVRGRDHESILLEAGAFHGHFCPFLALGVMAGVRAQQELDVDPERSDDIVVILETTGCFADGVQVATGCTFGNGALVYRDVGKTAFTLARRDTPDSGVRISVPDGNSIVRREYPDAFEQFVERRRSRDGSRETDSTVQEAWADVAFDLIDRPLSDFSEIETGVSVAIPDEPTADRSSVRCTACGEVVIESKAVEEDGEIRCRSCADRDVYQLDGNGIRYVDSS